MGMKNAGRAGTLYLFASLFNKGIAFLTVPIFTRLLSSSEYGIVTTYSAWVSIMTAVVGMQLNTSIRLSRGASFEYKIKKESELSTIFTFTLIVSFSLLALCIMFLKLFTTTSSTLIILCLLEALFTSLITDYTYYQMMEYKYVGRTLLMILPNLIAAIISIVLICFMNENRYLGRIYSLAFVHIIIGCIVCFFVFIKSKPMLDKSYIKWAIKVSAPLIVHGIALNILSQSDRTMITLLRDTSETGIYSLIYSFSMIATVITTGLEGIWIPWFTKMMNKGNYDSINVVSKDYINLMTYCMIGLIMISPELLKVMAPSNYWDGMNIIPPLVLSNYIIFAYTMYVNIEYYYEKTLFITINTIIAAVVNIVLNFLLIPRFGYFAAAFTTLASYFVSFTLHYIYARKLNTKVILIKDFVLPVFQILIFSIFFYVGNTVVIIRWGILASYLIAMLFKEKKRIQYYLGERPWR